MEFYCIPAVAKATLRLYTFQVDNQYFYTFYYSPFYSNYPVALCRSVECYYKGYTMYALL